MLARNADLWGLELDEHETTYSASESLLASLERRIAAAETLDDAKRIAAEGLGALRQKSVEQRIGPLAESAMQQAARREKSVRLEIEGGKVRWPASLAKVFDILPHLIRNSIDHGIEVPDERGEKPVTATIRLVCGASDDAFHVSVADDGRGIAVERVAQRAVEVGAVSAAEVTAMSPRERLELIFLGGVSTAEEVTQTSGRGVGMSAVKQAVDELSGSLTVESTPGRGTVFRIRFPRTPSTVRG
jgi:chemotaxis protein histidine kinase CheA